MHKDSRPLPQCYPNISKPKAITKTQVAKEMAPAVMAFGVCIALLGYSIWDAWQWSNFKTDLQNKINNGAYSTMEVK